LIFNFFGDIYSTNNNILDYKILQNENEVLIKLSTRFSKYIDFETFEVNAE